MGNNDAASNNMRRTAHGPARRPLLKRIIAAFFSTLLPLGATICATLTWAELQASLGVAAMESGFDVLDAATFLVFGALITLAVVIIVSLGQLPGPARSQTRSSAGGRRQRRRLDRPRGRRGAVAAGLDLGLPASGAARRGGGETRP
jgi:hypothetical protein